MDNAREFTSVSFTGALRKMGVLFVPSLPYSPQENREAEQLNRTLSDMARAMLVEGNMPPHFWQYAYSNACFIHNCLPNSRCPESSPYKELYSRRPSVATIYPFGAEAIVHIPASQQSHKLHLRGVTCKLLRPIDGSGGWLLWDAAKNCLIQSASVIFPAFQRDDIPAMVEHKGNGCNQFTTTSKRHGNSPAPGPNQHHWRDACMAELDQMKRRDVWEVVGKEKGMKTIGHQWVFDVKRRDDGSVEKFKARLVARGDRQRPGIDCIETYAPTASLMSLCLILATACCLI
ncbi:hypothetical protein O181_067475 [Austropuccinia psidii MF-1]|uniref:Integrase catalytic domain-containing protein n=1 Tax=Austropuccinia psidii MF-1 TaxID=1389203 RepID=A0A9Q3EQU9_9BASI|nr:hypothetical protein [Austropuccinia psidii MF-1]